MQTKYYIYLPSAEMELIAFTRFMTEIKGKQSLFYSQTIFVQPRFKTFPDSYILGHSEISSLRKVYGNETKKTHIFINLVTFYYPL